MATLCTALNAQDSGVGFKAGPLMSTMASEVLAHRPTLGATAGFYFPIRIGGSLELQPELLLAMMGSRYQLPDAEPVTIRIKYLHVPLTAKLYLDRGFHIQGGIQVGRRITAWRHVGDGTTNVTAAYRMFDIGLNGGFGMDFRRSVDLSLRYYAGIGPILENDDALFPRNRSLQLTMGFRFVSTGKHVVRRRR